jgi:hypothetical protein
MAIHPDGDAMALRDRAMVLRSLLRPQKRRRSVVLDAMSVTNTEIAWVVLIVLVVGILIIFSDVLYKWWRRKDDAA